MYRYDASTECVSDNLDCWSVPPTDVSLLSSAFVKYEPVTALAPNTKLEFVIKGSEKYYLNLSDTFLVTEVAIERANGMPLVPLVRNGGGAVTGGDKVGVVNNFFESLWSQIDVSYNDSQITSNTSTHAIVSYLKNLFGYNHEANGSWMQNGLWCIDESGKLADNDHTEDDANEALKWRSSFLLDGKSTQLIGRLHADALNLDKALLNNIDVRIGLVRNKCAFSLMSPDARQYRIVIKAASLYVKKILPNPSLILAHEKLLRSTNAQYHLQKHDVSFTHIPIGVGSFTRDNITFQQVPKFILVGLVDDRNLQGDQKRNPYEYNLNNLSEVRVTKDGIDAFLSPIKLDHPNCLMGYQTLFAAGNLGLYANDGIPISRASYLQGFGFQLFTFAPDPCGNHLTPVSKASIKIELSFSQPTAVNLNLMILSVSDQILHIDYNRKCFIEN